MAKLPHLRCCGNYNCIALQSFPAFRSWPWCLIINSSLLSSDCFSLLSSKIVSCSLTNLHDFNHLCETLKCLSFLYSLSVYHALDERQTINLGIKSNSSNCIPIYVITAAKTVHLCYWQPKWPSHPVFLSGCFVVLFSKMKFLFPKWNQFLPAKNKIVPISSFADLFHRLNVSHFELHVPISQTFSDLVSSGKLGNSCVQKISIHICVWHDVSPLRCKVNGSNSSDTVKIVIFKKIYLAHEQSRIVF